MQIDAVLNACGSDFDTIFTQIGIQIGLKKVLGSPRTLLFQKILFFIDLVYVASVASGLN